MIKVLIADDHPLIRSGIRNALAGVPDCELVGEAATATEVLDICKWSTPDLLLLDLIMPGPSPVEVITTLKKNYPDAKIIILTAHQESIFFRNMVALGVNGYLLKDEAIESLVDAIQQVMAGEVWCSKIFMDVYRQNRPTPATFDQLTDRELEVLTLVGRGLTNEQIAQELDITPRTVRSHVEKILAKMSAQNRMEAVDMAKKFRLI